MADEVEITLAGEPALPESESETPTEDEASAEDETAPPTDEPAEDGAAPAELVTAPVVSETAPTSSKSLESVATTATNTSLPNNNTHNEAALNTTNHVYIHSDEYAWIPARVEKTEDNGTKAHVVIPEYKDERSIQSDGGRKAKRFRKEVISLEDYPNKALPMQNVDEKGNLKEVEDMVDLPFLHEVC